MDSKPVQIRINEIERLFARLVLLNLSREFDFKTNQSDFDSASSKLKYEILRLNGSVDWKAELDSSEKLLLTLDNRGNISGLSQGLSSSFSLGDNIFENGVNSNITDFPKNDIKKSSFIIFEGSDQEHFFLIFKSNNSGYISFVQKKAWFDSAKKIGLDLVVNAEDRERRRLAIDLHDSLGQHLTGIRFLLDSLKANDENPILNKAVRALDMSIEELRNISYNLIPKPLDEEPLHIALFEFFERVKSMFGVKVLFKYNETLKIEFIKSFEVSLFRVIQEIVTNSVKHGKSSRINVEFKLSEDLLQLNIEDNGEGFDMKKVKKLGHGLKNLETRVKKYDGVLNRQSSEGSGTKYNLLFPLNAIENL